MSHTLFNDVTVEQQETVVGGIRLLKKKQLLKQYIENKVFSKIYDIVDKLH